MKKGMIKPFHLGLTVVIVMLILSIGWTFFWEAPEAERFMYDENGALIDTPPYPISRTHWLGADREGNDLFYLIISGAKWTIMFAFSVTALRVFTAGFLGLMGRRMVASRWMNSFFQAFHYIPQSLLAIIWLAPYILYELRGTSPLSFVETIVLQLAVLTIVGVPTLTKVVAETANHIHTFDFMESARVLGGNGWHLSRVHVFPHLFPRLLILFGRQFVQVLTLMLHLAIFHIFIGGTNIGSGQEHDQFVVYYTPVFEWAGIIGTRYKELLLEPTIIAFPVLAYSLLIMTVDMMVNGMEENFRTDGTTVHK
ncbi:ABC transporter permease subunit [Rossellomorea aquimaris]|uniref:ABC transporter permease subunit n=1 Tax=Rossellomorea aquimaris TaxID=189382 RepID=UPI001CD59B35|nr:ABC transporter permease subunit [Rossellomorea aquimaris]MCA1055655.1 ABC transporter permease subunit [Rossellomorea aquimaris]